VLSLAAKAEIVVPAPLKHDVLTSRRTTAMRRALVRFSLAAAAGIAMATTIPLASAQDDKAPEVKLEEVVGGLSNPCGVAVQPGSGQVFVSDSATGRVCRIVEGKLQDVLTGSPSDIYGKGPMYQIGPLGLVFLDGGKTLAVGDGGYKDGFECVRVYDVPEAGKTLDYEKDAKAKLGPLEPAEGVLGEGNLYALAAGPNAIYATSNGDDTKGWVARAEFDGGKFGNLERWLATKEAVEVDAPVGITLSPRGEIVIGQMGEINKPKDSLLSFYSAKTGKLILNLETGLHDITALAYSPKTGLLYATDFAWMATDEGALYRLDATSGDNGQGVKAVKITNLDKPTAMSFAEDGTLYITVVGPKKEDDNAPKEGKLLKIAPGL
jgi:DNA-binding beta-propeller fold protein YncE